MILSLRSRMTAGMTSRRDRGDRGKGREIPDKMIVDPRLREDDEEGGAGNISGETRRD